MDSKATKLTFIGYGIEQKQFRFVDVETDLITISRDATELGNGSSSVETWIDATRNNPEEDIQLIPFKEEKEEVNEEASDSGSYVTSADNDGSVDEAKGEGESVSSSNVSRSRRTTQGTLSR